MTFSVAEELVPLVVGHLDLVAATRLHVEPAGSLAAIDRSGAFGTSQRPTLVLST